MKKVLSLVLTLSLVLGTFSMAFAATTKFADVKGEKCEDAVNVLTELGVVAGYEDGTYQPEKIVTRAEMCVLVINALGLSDYVTSGTSSFTDMDGYGWAQGYVAYAESLKVVSGYGDGTFRPGNTVSYDEAATMLVAALGYTTVCLPGSWPANYVTKAKTLGILDGIVAGSTGANRGDIAIMLYQTLDQYIGYVNSDGDFVANGKTVNGNFVSTDTMLKRLGAEETNGGNAFVVGVSDVEDAVVNIREYLGAFVTAYENEDGEIIAISEVKSTFLTGTFTSDTKFEAKDGTEYTIDAYSYIEKDETGEVKNKTADPVGFENGGYGDIDTKLDVLDLDKTYTLAVELSGKRFKSVYSVHDWTETDAAQIDADDIKDITSNDKFLGVDFPLTNNDEIDTNAFELVGIDSLDDLKVDDIAYVYKNPDTDEIAKIAASNETVTGTVTRVTSDGKKVTISGNTYKYAEANTNGEFGEAAVGAIKGGDEVTLYLDAYGYIYDFEKTSGKADKYAVVLKTGVSGGMDSAFQIRLLTADGNSTLFNMKEDVEITGIISKTEWKTGWAGADGTDAAGTLIKYGLNKDGEITEIKLIEDPGTGKVGVTGRAITSKGIYNGKEINSDAVIFTLDGDKTKSGDYTVTTLAKVLDSDDIDYGTYFLDNNKIVAMLLDGYKAGDDTFGVLTEWYDGEEDDMYEFEMYVDGKLVEYPSEMSGSGYNIAAVYSVTFNGAGEIKDGGLEKILTTTDGAFAAEDKGIVFDVADGAISAPSQSGSTFKLTFTPTAGVAKQYSYTLDSSVAVYLLDDGDWSIEGKSLLRNLKPDDSVYLYNVGSDDKDVVTIVIVERP